MRRISQEQEHAVELCADMHERIVGVTGGAGTGKTFVLGEAYKELRRYHDAQDIVLCAPTGRAAKRVQELTGIRATTIHRLLQFPTPEDYDPKNDEDPPENKPRRGRGFPLDQRIVFVDEASMLGPTLYIQLMEALRPNGCIRFFGDNNQLPPVEEGEPPFLKILQRESGNVTLTHNFRSDDFIVSNALRILEGRVPVRNERFQIIYTDTPIPDLIKMVTPDFMRSEYQIIMPTKRGNYGTLRVNPSLQVRLNGTGASLKLDRHEDKENQLAVRAKDKFLWIRNDYQLNMFNGDLGVIEWVNDEDGSLSLVTPDRQLIVPARLKTYSPYHGTTIQYDPRKHIELGYAITTHKSQGSEFRTIIYCICGAQAFLLNRRNLYTAITRAKHQVIMITDRRAMSLALRKER